MTLNRGSLAGLLLRSAAGVLAVLLFLSMSAMAQQAGDLVSRRVVTIRFIRGKAD